MRTLLFFLIFFMANGIFGQLPETNIYLCDIKTENSTLSISSPKLVNSFNLNGYNNQPYFMSREKLYFSLSEDMKNTEIVGLNLNTLDYWFVTKTYENEYSPTLTPNPRFFSTVRVEADKETQVLWKYPMDQTNTGKKVLDLTGIGYHCWIDRTKLALFVINETFDLVIANTITNEHETVVENIGRCMKKNKAGNLLFVHKLSETDWYIKEYNLTTKKITIIKSTLPGSEDFELMDDGSLIMAKGTGLYRLNITASSWEEIANFKELGIDGITRLSIKGNKLAFVCGN